VTAHSVADEISKPNGMEARHRAQKQNHGGGKHSANKAKINQRKKMQQSSEHQSQFNKRLEKEKRCTPGREAARPSESELPEKIGNPRIFQQNGSC